MPEALRLHDTAIAEAVESCGGELLKSRGEGDSTFSVFSRSSDASSALAHLAAAAVDPTPMAGACAAQGANGRTRL